MIDHLRHSLAHLLAAAVLDLYPDTKPTIGPAIDNGFYYDFQFSESISDKDLGKIEKQMKKILKTWKEFAGQEVSEKEAKEKFASNPFKLELIDEIVAKGEKITLYTSGEFTDLCRGGHIDDISAVSADAFRLDRVAGAYWRGDEKNPMLTRIYGLAFETKDELDQYLVQRVEAEKRDHKKLGPALKLFTISPLIGAGLPLIQPKGMIIRQAIADYLWELHQDKGYQRVWTPHIAREALYEISGHAANFGDELFRVKGKDEEFVMKPMNCPHHMQIFADNQFSYRDMPVRYFEPATVYRDEKSGQLGGLTRVRAITQDDGHLFCREDQIEQEVSTIVEIIKIFYARVGMMADYWVRLSVRGDDAKYIGSDQVWQTAEQALDNAAKKNDLNYRRVEGEAAFYGPKLDFMFRDAIGREWQLATIQCDFNLPERFDLSFINTQGEKERPVVIHRAIAGSLERFMGVMIEHYAGAFPLWLAPTQVTIVPVSEKFNDYAREIVAKLKTKDIRVELDDSAETLGKRVRNAEKMKTPYIIVVGEKEVESQTIAIRQRGTGDLGAKKVEEFVEMLVGEMK